MNDGPLFVDTSAWFALVNRDDPDHGPVRDTLQRFDRRLITSNFIFDETITLCLVRLGHAAARQIGDVLRSGDVADLARATLADETAAWERFCLRSDKRYSFTDCVSFAMMQRLGIGRAAAVDDDFRREGFDVLP